jgi:hypothetical protein
MPDVREHIETHQPSLKSAITAIGAFLDEK